MDSVNGPVLIKPKQTVDVKVYAREKEHIESSGWFTIQGTYEADPSIAGQAGGSAAAGGDNKKSDAEIARLNGLR